MAQKKQKSIIHKIFQVVCIRFRFKYPARVDQLGADHPVRASDIDTHRKSGQAINPKGIDVHTLKINQHQLKRQAYVQSVCAENNHHRSHDRFAPFSHPDTGSPLKNRTQNIARLGSPAKTNHKYRENLPTKYTPSTHFDLVVSIFWPRPQTIKECFCIREDGRQSSPHA